MMRGWACPPRCRGPLGDCFLLLPLGTRDAVPVVSPVGFFVVCRACCLRAPGFPVSGFRFSVSGFRFCLLTSRTSWQVACPLGGWYSPAFPLL